MVDITQSIFELKDKLIKLEEAHDKKIKNYEERKKAYDSLKTKYDSIKEYQNDVIYFNIGGKKCPTNRSLIVNSIYKSVLKDVLSNLEKMGKSKTDSSKIFIDRNPESFPYILDILRKSYQAYLSSNLDIALIGDLKVFIDPKVTLPDTFLEDVKFYFKDDYELVQQHFRVFTSDGVERSVTQSNIGGVLSVKVSADFPSDVLNPYRAKTFKDISKKNSKKGFFISYDSNIQFSLENEIDFSKLEIKPFSANLDYWVPCEGAGTFVFSSLTGGDNNDNWEFCASLPEDYGLEFENDKTYTINFDKRRARYIKLQTGDYTLSVSYIKFS